MPRIPEQNEDLIGTVCCCSLGRIAIVSGRKKMPWGEAWVGVGFDGKGLWSSTSPVVLYELVSDYATKLAIIAK